MATFNGEVIASDEEIIKALGREDYYTILKNRKHPEDWREHRWAAMRTKWTILNRNYRL